MSRVSDDEWRYRNYPSIFFSSSVLSHCFRTREERNINDAMKRSITKIKEERKKIIDKWIDRQKKTSPVLLFYTHWLWFENRKKKKRKKNADLISSSTKEYATTDYPDHFYLSAATPDEATLPNTALSCTCSHLSSKPSLELPHQSHSCNLPNTGIQEGYFLYPFLACSNW